MLAAFGNGSASTQERVTVISRRHLTDDEVIETATVTVRGRTIGAVTAGDALPPAAGGDVAVVDRRDRSLLPGLIDAHTQLRSRPRECAQRRGDNRPQHVHRAESGRRMAAGAGAGPVTGQVDMFSAGVAVTVENGHGTFITRGHKYDNRRQARASG